jgi:hypothetical protein
MRLIPLDVAGENGSVRRRAEGSENTHVEKFDFFASDLKRGGGA